jgi:hypothetical protein
MFGRRARDAQLGELAERVRTLEARLEEERRAKEALSQRLAELGSAAARPAAPPAEELLGRLQQVLDATAVASTKAAAAMDDRVDGLVGARLDAVRAELDERATGAALEAESRIASLDERTTEQAADTERRLGELQAMTTALAGEVEGVRHRVVELAEALTRQFDELGGELDGLASRSLEQDRRLATLADATAALPVGAVSADDLDARAGELRANQARIANELVRFELALRQEVAHLAEKVQVAAARNGSRH